VIGISCLLNDGTIINEYFDKRKLFSTTYVDKIIFSCVSSIILEKSLRIFSKFQTKFDKDAVRDIIRYAIKENVGTSQQYDAKLITTWSNELMEACLVALTKLQKPFKYIGMIIKDYNRVICT
jgi:hypothetical protein